jgi:hypothetical protein
LELWFRFEARSAFDIASTRIASIEVRVAVPCPLIDAERVKQFLAVLCGRLHGFLGSEVVAADGIDVVSRVIEDHEL